MTRAKEAFEDWIGDLIADPAHQDNPLLGPLAEVFYRYSEQIRLLERITHISDQYQAAQIESKENDLNFYRRKVRQAEKMIRISDQYQSMMQELNDRLRQLSSFDDLTGLPNRRVTQHTLDDLIAQARDSGDPLSVALMDVDFFKTINDCFGHATGDVALQRIAFTLKEGLSPGDLCGRWGGEEFVVLMPSTPTEAAAARVEAMRTAIYDLRIDADEGGPIRMTASFGLTLLQDGDSSHNLLARADQALYEAKTQGRNRLIIR